MTETINVEDFLKMVGEQAEHDPVLREQISAVLSGTSSEEAWKIGRTTEEISIVDKSGVATFADLNYETLKDQMESLLKKVDEHDIEVNISSELEAQSAIEKIDKISEKLSIVDDTNQNCETLKDKMESSPEKVDENEIRVSTELQALSV